MIMSRTFLASILLLLCSGVGAASFEGRTVHVIDGDGLIVQVSDKRVNVRLEHIDAPELGQGPYGLRSRPSLVSLCGGEVATVHASGRDRNGRTLGRAVCNGKEANGEQVRQGMAMVFERYAPQGSPLYGLQEEARAARRGLWAEPQPVPPWEWRDANRT